MAVENVGTLTSYYLAEPAGWRQLVELENQATYEAWEFDAGESVLGGLLPGLSDAALVLPTRTILYRELNGATRDDSTATGTWFEDVHTIPKSLDFGLVVTTASMQVEVYNAYRRTPQTFDSFTNNGGPGIDLIGETLPTVFAPLTGSGLTLTVEVTTEGDPVVDSTLIFGWTVADNVVTISLTRVVPFATSRGLLLPEDEIAELLIFLTDVIEKATGKEQRFKLREYPRQVFEHTYKIGDEQVRSELDMKLAAFQHRLWAVGVWEHELPVTAAVTAGDTVVNVGPTAYSDFRVGGSAAIFVEGGAYDIGGISAVGANSVTFSTPLSNDYPVGARVVPTRAAHLTPSITGARWPVNLSRLEMRFEVQENVVDLADASGFSSFNGRVVFDDFNFQGATAQEGYTRRLSIIDGEVGIRAVGSSELFSRQTGVKTFLSKTRADNFAVRGVLHALAGRFASFYLPTFRTDVVLAEKLVFDETEMVIDFIGYAATMNAAEPKVGVRIVKTDGTTLDRLIQSATEAVDGETETLVVDTAWPADVELADVSRIYFLHKTRFNSDTMRIEHMRGGRTMKASAPTKVVLE